MGRTLHGGSGRPASPSRVAPPSTPGQPRGAPVQEVPVRPLRPHRAASAVPVAAESSLLPATGVPGSFPGGTCPRSWPRVPRLAFGRAAP
eukprot:scaffold1594_cov401-Prasinococcus_capsulatus_cf.AAC.10